MRRATRRSLCHRRSGECFLLQAWNLSERHTRHPWEPKFLRRRPEEWNTLDRAGLTVRRIRRRHPSSPGIPGLTLASAMDGHGISDEQARRGGATLTGDVLACRRVPDFDLAYERIFSGTGQPGKPRG